MNIKKYHRNIFWESIFDAFFEKHNIKEIIFSKHVKENQFKEAKRIYDINDITLDFLKKGVIFETETKEEKIIKIVVRNKYKEKNDICTALAVDDDVLIVKTCYLNKQDDMHYTLNPKNYYNPNFKKGKTIETTITIGELVAYKNTKK